MAIMAKIIKKEAAFKMPLQNHIGGCSVMFRFITLILSVLFLTTSWPVIEKQLENPGAAVDRVQAEVHSLGKNPEIAGAATALLGDFQQFIKHTWVLVTEIMEDRESRQPSDTDNLDTKPAERF